DGWVARCPGPTHGAGDQRPSLSTSEGQDRILIKCHTGCTAEQIMAALGLRLSDLFFNKRASMRRGDEAHGRMVRTYDYTDETGKLLFQVCRYDPKDFRQRRPNGQGGWLSSVKGVRRVLYHLPQLAGQSRAFFVEGEKDADNLAALGLVSTTSAG